MFKLHNSTPEGWGEAAGLLTSAVLSGAFSGSILIACYVYVGGWLAGIGVRIGLMAIEVRRRRCQT